jgi:1-acyl-sn-glycerol-3-phosphate acyltransferase
VKAHKDKFDFRPPSKVDAKKFIAPFKFYFAPQYFGIDEIDASRPAMYVTNHTVLGLLDGYPFAVELYLRKGILLRGLTDSMHHHIPYWKDYLTKRLGGVEASRENCQALMERGDSLIVFPGGTREICKKKGEAYVLKWSDRTGFVRMAMKNGYDIIPVAAVGGEEAYTVVKDSNDFINDSSLGKLLKQTGLLHSVFKDGELIPPIIHGIGNTIIPRPEKLYFAFGKRISTKRFKNKHEDKETLELVKSRVEDEMYKMFMKLFDIKKNDKDVSFIRKFFTSKK